MTGRFITLEGGEGSGKTTQIRLLHERLQASGKQVVLTREPGGEAGSEAIRALLVSGDADKWDVMAETLLFQAARVQHVSRLIRPALAEGKWVVCDRFLDSTLVYQGMAKRLGVETIRELHALSLKSFQPDLTFILDVDPELGLRRAALRESRETRFEQMGAGFHHMVREGFRTLAAARPERYAVIDAGASPQTVHDAIWDELNRRMPA